ncbi:hypothetical protein C4577_07985 [Candidatus Parcubacteria bacterium]|nr:MAG: hypothetical protein C4577_07985 [Candidatus Parcubacteria bacterium]
MGENIKDFGFETEKNLEDASVEVAQGYIFDIISDNKGLSLKKDTEWQNLAEKYPPFTYKILTLRRIFKKANQLKEVISFKEKAEYERHFSNFPMDTAMILTDILLSRVIKEDGTPKTKEECEQEAQEIIANLLLSIKSRNLTQETITLVDTIKLALEGKLNIEVTQPTTQNPTYKNI